MLDRYKGDLRAMRSEAERDPREIRRQLTEFPNLGPVGADIFCREAQEVWPELRPYLDKKALDGAERLSLPKGPHSLARFVEDVDLARFAAALVRVTLEKGLADSVIEAST